MTAISSNQILNQYKNFVQASHSLASTLELRPLLENIMGFAVELVGAEEAAVLLYDQHNQKIYLEAATYSAGLPRGQKIFIPDESAAGWVAANQVPQIKNNLDQDQNVFLYNEDEKGLIIHSLVAVPMVTKQRLIGVLEVINKKMASSTRTTRKYCWHSPLNPP
jgi:transcriptional regulator with GAF, ATPase, and Fis domain